MQHTNLPTRNITWLVPNSKDPSPQQGTIPSGPFHPGKYNPHPKNTSYCFGKRSRMFLVAFLFYFRVAAVAAWGIMRGDIEEGWGVLEGFWLDRL
jgi:hypothetical protein